MSACLAFGDSVLWVKVVFRRCRSVGAMRFRKGIRARFARWGEPKTSPRRLRLWEIASLGNLVETFCAAKS